MVTMAPQYTYDGPCPQPAEVTNFVELANGERHWICGCGFCPEPDPTPACDTMASMVPPCTVRTEAGARAGAPCPNCGHTNLVHPGPDNPDVVECVICGLTMPMAVPVRERRRGPIQREPTTREPAEGETEPTGRE
jgi:Zn ribbon nucleic-acid-binding protein